MNHARVNLMCIHNRTSRRGVTLIECMVAIIIVTIAVLSASMSIQHGILAQEDALRLSLAASAAESRLTELLVREYDQMTPSTTSEAVGAMMAPMGSNDLPADYASLGRQTQIADDSIAIPGYTGLLLEGKMLTIEVFDSEGGQDRELVRIRRFRPKTIEEELAE